MQSPREAQHGHDILDDRELTDRAEYVLARTNPPRGASVLNFYCGDGRLLTRIKELRPDLVCHGVDADSSKVAQLEKSVDGLRFDVGDVMERAEFLGEYDCIFSYRALRYVPTAELEDLFRILGGHLKASGSIWHLSVPDGRKRWQYWLEDFQNSHDGGALPDALKAGRFFLAHLWRLVRDNRQFGDDSSSYYHDHGTLTRSAGEGCKVEVLRPSDLWYFFDVRITQRS